MGDIGVKKSRASRSTNASLSILLRPALPVLRRSSLVAALMLQDTALLNTERVLDVLTNNLVGKRR